MARMRKDKAYRAAEASLRKMRRDRYRRANPVGNMVGIFVAVVLILGCAVTIISDKREFSEKQKELAALQERALELEAENAGYASILSEEDERTYMERIAIEKLGYAYPDERRFYDTTRS